MDKNMERSGQSSAFSTNRQHEPQTKKELLPLRINHEKFPEIHRKLAIEYGVANKLCEDCGKVGDLTCFSISFRKWALGRITEKDLQEFNQTCSRCKQVGHICVNCDVPITYTTDEATSTRKKIQHCGVCRAVGHNCRSCSKAV